MRFSYCYCLQTLEKYATEDEFCTGRMIPKTAKLRARNDSLRKHRKLMIENHGTVLL